MRKIPYRLLATATAAPNDYIELGTSSEALGYMGLLLGIHAAFTTLLPLAIIVLIAYWLLFRVP